MARSTRPSAISTLSLTLVSLTVFSAIPGAERGQSFDQRGHKDDLADIGHADRHRARGKQRIEKGSRD
jgi:hypothetical protein